MKLDMIAVLFLSLFVSGCSIYHVDSVDTTEDYYPSKQTANEVVYLETVDKPHQVIAQVVVNTERRKTINEVLGKIKREAAILGGDAITNIRTDASGGWRKLPAQELIGNGYIRANFTADVVVYADTPKI